MVSSTSKVTFFWKSHYLGEGRQFQSDLFYSLATYIFVDMEDITQLFHQMSITVPISGH